jgi:hypothetical protein
VTTNNRQPHWPSDTCAKHKSTYRKHLVVLIEDQPAPCTFGHTEHGRQWRRQSSKAIRARRKVAAAVEATKRAAGTGGRALRRRPQEARKQPAKRQLAKDGGQQRDTKRGSQHGERAVDRRDVEVPSGLADHVRVRRVADAVVAQLSGTRSKQQHETHR